MVLHRNLKPDNIGFTLDQKLKLIDLGLSKDRRERDACVRGRVQDERGDGQLEVHGALTITL